MRVTYMLLKKIDRLTKTALVLLILLLLVMTPVAALTESGYAGILEEIDNLQSFGSSDFTTQYTIVSEKPGEEREVFEMRLFRRDVENLFLMLIISPEIQKGQGYLQLDDNLWFYDPESRKFEHSSVRENIQSSDAKNSDLMEQTLSEDYRVVSHEEGILGNVPVYILNLEALHDEVAYPTMKLWVRQTPTLPMKSEEYGFSGRLMRSSAYLNYVKVGDRYLPSRILLVDMLNIGEKTQITMTNPSVGTLPDYIFTKAYLEQVNK